MEFFHPGNETVLLEENGYIETLTAIQKRLEPFRLSGSFSSFDGTRLGWEGYLAENAVAAVVILHGFTEFPGKYLEMAWYFLNRGYHVFLPTQRGHASGGIIHVEHFDDYVRDLHCFTAEFRACAGPLPMYLYAHSMGGGVAARHLQEYPGEYQKAVLSAPLFCPRAGDLPYPIALLGTRFLLRRGERETSTLLHCRFNPNATLETSSASSEARFRWNMKCRIENPAYQTDGATNRWIYESVALRRHVLRRKNCKKICVPVLLFSAGQDTQVRIEEHRIFAKRAPDVRYYFYPDQKHELFSKKNEFLQEYLDKIFTFLEE